MRLIKLICTSVVGLVMSLGTAQAQQAARIVVPFAAGGGTDQYVRLMVAELNKRGMQVIVENKPGASGIVAASEACRSS